MPVDQAEVQAELLLHLILPLACYAARRYYKDLANHAPEEQFLYEQAGHDRLPGAGIVCEQESDAGQRAGVVVNGFHLMG